MMNFGILGLVFFLFNSVFPPNNSPWHFFEGLNQPVLIAHRGAKGTAPENTLASVQAAIDGGAPWVEVDVHRSSDGVLVVMHDRSVNRTTDGRGRIAALTWPEIKALDAGGWFAEKFSGEPVPRLSEILDIMGGRANLLIELKARGIASTAVELIETLGVADSVAFQSFSAECIHEVKRRAPHIPAYILIHTPKFSSDDRRAARWMVSMAEAVNADGLGLYHRYITPSLRSLTNQHGLSLYAWTVNSPVRFRELAALGVDGVVTDRPDLLALLTLRPSMSSFGRSAREHWSERASRLHP